MSIPTFLELKPLRQSAGLTFLVAFLLSSPVGAHENPYAQEPRQSSGRCGPSWLRA
jgi:hypothetical protein